MRDLVSRIHRKAHLIGDDKSIIKGVSSFEGVSPGYLCFYNGKGEQGQEEINASGGDVFIIHRDNAMALKFSGKFSLVLVENPLLYFIDCINLLFPPEKRHGIETGSFVDLASHLAEDILIEKCAIVDKDVHIGCHSEVHSGVRLYEGTRIGERVVIQSNTVIGAVGLAYGQEEDGSYTTLPHLGGVIIGDNVDIGANSTVVRGVLKDTIVGKGSKIGNMVNIGHNVSIGRNCFISSGAILCGSVHVEDNCWLAPGAKILNKVVVGEGAKVALGAVVTKDVERGSLVAGASARYLAHMYDKNEK